jgi:hypothetical protein
MYKNLDNALSFKKCTYRVVHIAGEHLASEFTAINPIRRVPVIDDNGFILTERWVIIRHYIRPRPFLLTSFRKANCVPIQYCHTEVSRTQVSGARPLAS